MNNYANCIDFIYFLKEYPPERQVELDNVYFIILCILLEKVITLHIILFFKFRSIYSLTFDTPAEKKWLQYKISTISVLQP